MSKKKDKKVSVKKIEIRIEGGLYAYARPKGETYSGGYASAFSAKRGAYRNLDARTALGVPYNEVKRPSMLSFYTPKGQFIVFINNY